jgi:hypothetical protein
MNIINFLIFIGRKLLVKTNKQVWKTGKGENS